MILSSDLPVGIEKIVEILITPSKSDKSTFGNDLRPNIKILSVSKEKVVVSYKLGTEGCNLMGNMHGATFSLLADEISSLSIMASDHSLRPSVTINLSINCLVGVPCGSTIRIESRLEKIGKHVAFADVSFYNSNGVLVATAKHTKAMLNVGDISQKKASL